MRIMNKAMQQDANSQIEQDVAKKYLPEIKRGWKKQECIIPEEEARIQDAMNLVGG